MIDLLPNEEQRDLVDAAAGFLASELPMVRVREIAASGQAYDAGFWKLCAKQGWYGLTLPQSDGGAGYSLAEESLLFRELGRHLIPGPVLPTVLAARIAASAGADTVAAELVGGIRLAGLAETQAGDNDFLVWIAGPVDLLVVVDVAANEIELVEASQMECARVARSLDPAYGIAEGSRRDLGEPVATANAAEVVRHGTVLLAAMLSGIAEAERDIGAAYAKERVQFGRPIGSFQAVKHRAADTAVRAEAAWCQTAVAALRVAGCAEDAAFHASCAKLVAGDAAIRNGRDTIQNLGGIGFTAEHDAHLYLKRAHVLEHVLGDRYRQLATVLEPRAAF
jgi:alkylation response protein AidB-like acyl-CoA dehydrogenase